MIPDQPASYLLWVIIHSTSEYPRMLSKGLLVETLLTLELLLPGAVVGPMVTPINMTIFRVFGALLPQIGNHSGSASQETALNEIPAVV